MRDRWMRWGIVTVGMMLVGQTMPAGGEGALKELADHWAGLKDVRTLEARFVCEKVLAALDTPLHSEGRLWIGKGGGGAKDEGNAGVRFSTEKPYVSELILSGGKVFARSQHEAEWTKTNQAARPGLTAVMGQLGGWSTGDSSKIAEMYSVARSSEPVPAVPLDGAEKTERAADVFILTPTNADLAKSVKSVTLALDRQTNFLRYIQILTQQDDVTRYWFLDVKGNAALPADVFKAGTELMVPGEGGGR